MKSRIILTGIAILCMGALIAQDTILLTINGKDAFLFDTSRIQILNNEGNVLIGEGTGVSGAFSTIIGTNAGQYLSTDTSNVIIGYNASNGATSQRRNTVIGTMAGVDNDGFGNVLLGYQAGSNTSTSNTLIIDNSGAGDPLIYGKFNDDMLRINGELQIRDQYRFPLVSGSTGQILKTDNMGQLSWQSDATDDADSSPLNELIASFGLNFPLLELQDAGGLLTVDMSPFYNIQTLSISQDSIYISEGNGVPVPPAAHIEDSDGDTRVEAENLPSDQITFSVDNEEVLSIHRYHRFNTHQAQNLFFGDQAGVQNNISFGIANTVFGNESGMKNTTGAYNVFVGDQAGRDNLDASDNVFLGFQAGIFNDTGEKNTFVGSNTGRANDADANTFVGFSSGEKNSSGFENTFMGANAGKDNTVGANNTFIGARSGWYNVAGTNNTFVGNDAGHNEKGSQNVYIGSGAGAPLNATHTDTGNVFIGYMAGANMAGSNNRLAIENSDATNPLIYGEFDNDLLQVNGRLVLGASPGDEMTILNSSEWTHLTGIQDFGDGLDHFILASKEGSSESAGIYGDGDHITLWSAGDGAPGQPAAFLYILDEDFFDGGTDSDPFNNSSVVMYLASDGMWTASDRNRKTGIRALDSGALDRIRGIGTYIYRYKQSADDAAKATPQPQIVGLMAQDLEKHIPQAVNQNDHGEYFVNYSQVVPVLLEAIKEQQQLIEEQGEAIVRLEKRFEEIGRQADR